MKLVICSVSLLREPRKDREKKQIKYIPLHIHEPRMLYTSKIAKKLNIVTERLGLKLKS